MISGLIAAVIATAPAGGCSARQTMVKAIVSPTATASLSAGSAISRHEATPRMAAYEFPTIAAQGWASGLFGTAKSSTDVAPKGAIR